MKLNELLELKYAYKGKKSETSIDEIYGIIYRIYCIPENKSYIGQTFSHDYVGKYVTKTGIIKRIKVHWSKKDEEIYNKRPLYKAFLKYTPDQFEVSEEKRLYNTEIAKINQIEGQYIQHYDCLYPNGYNIEEIGKRFGKIFQKLSEHYSFDIKRTEYMDTTRDRRCKDIMVGKYFNLPRSQIDKDIVLKNLKSIKIEKIRLTDSNGLRILVKPVNENINIRIYFNGSKQECIEYVKHLTDNIELSEAFRGKQCYKYQSKIEKVLELAEHICEVTGKSYTNKARNHETYLLMFYGKKNNKSQNLLRISFGGASQSIQKSYDTAMEFLDRLLKYSKLDHFTYNLSQLSLLNEKSMSATGGCSGDSEVNSDTA